MVLEKEYRHYFINNSHNVHSLSLFPLSKFINEHFRTSVNHIYGVNSNMIDKKWSDFVSLAWKPLINSKYFGYIHYIR